MPLCVRRNVQKMAGIFWEDVKAPLEKAVMSRAVWELSTDDNQKAPAEAASAKQQHCWRRWRAWFLYHWSPYDCNLWTKLCDPWFLLFNALLCLPLASVRIIFSKLS